MKAKKTPAIVADSLSKKFGAVAAVNGVSFTVRRGEIFGFLGPNGAGKTTIIRMLTGLLLPDSGTAFIDGIDIKRASIQAKMKMGVIPEMGNIYADLTARQNVLLTGKFYGMPKRELNERTDALLEEFGLFDRRKDPVRTFSKGMKQRVNIASAIVHRPEILFLDEPTSGLDVQSRRMIIENIQAMKRSGATVFLTTHNIEEANHLCGRVAIINQGAIAAIDRPEKLKKTFRTTQSVEIAFHKSVAAARLRKITPVNRVDRLGDKWKLYTDAPDRLVKALAHFAQESRLRILSVQTCGASLEDVFVRFTEISTAGAAGQKYSAGQKPKRKAK